MLRFDRKTRMIGDKLTLGGSGSEAGRDRGQEAEEHDQVNDESDTPQETMTLAPAPEKAPEGPSLGIETVIEENQSPALACPVLGFGASSGGLKASKGGPENLDPNTGMAFVLTTHLAPDQKSFLSEIVGRYTNMPVISMQEQARQAGG